MVDVKFSMFLDKPGVLAAIDKKRRRVFGRTGSFGRQVMRRQMRKGGKSKKTKTSLPGNPPRRHQNPLLYKLLYFGVDPETDTLVIGPQKINAGGSTTTKGGQTIPDLLNTGGAAVLLGDNGLAKTANYLPRPFTDPVQPTIDSHYSRMIEEAPLTA